MQHPPKKRPVRRRKRWQVLLLIAALVLSAALVLLLPGIRRQFPAKAPDYDVVQSTVRTLDTREAESIDTVTIYPDGISSYVLKMADGALMLERDGELSAIASDYQSDILETITQISVQDTVTENAADAADELGAMGLLTPRCKAVVRYADGAEETMEVGAQILGGTDYYFRWSGAEGIYTCHSGVLETLSIQQNLLIPFTQTSVYGALVESLRIRNANGECAFAFSGGTSGSLTEPCVYPMTDDTAQTLVTAMSSFRLGAYEAPLTDENRSFYGFDEPLCTLDIVQAEGAGSAVSEDGTLKAVVIPAQTLQFVIGRAEGDYFYTCAYQGDVYLISRFLAETLVQANWKSLISRTPAAMGDRQLSYIVFETPETTVEVQITRTESVLENNELEMDAEGNIVYLTTAAVNGQTVPQEQLDILLDSLNAFAVEGELPANASVDSEPRWRITLIAQNGETRVLEGYRLDAFSDAVAVNGVMCHYVYDEAIDTLMAGLV